MDLVVAADDRTGAFEVAGRLADAGTGPVTVTAWPDQGRGDGPRVVDLGSRHLSPGEAHGRALALSGRGGVRGHKIDSTLRGNWAEELVARTAAGPVLLVPALPEYGRTCVEGEVLEHGRPVHEGAAGTDVRRRVTSSRPAALLRAAGAEVVVAIHDDEGLGEWLARPTGIAVADASTDDDVGRIVEQWRTHAGDSVLAGTSAVLGRLAPEGTPPAPLAIAAGPVLVVCGSVHPTARAQLRFVERRGMTITSLVDDITARQLERDGAIVVATEIPVGDVDEPLAIAAVAGLARGVADLRERVDLAAMILIGGDTAAAVLGDRPATVHGTAGPGTGWATVDDDALPVITRSGGFGSEAALHELIVATHRA